MKRAIKYLAIASAALAFLAACTKEKSETSAYVPATPESGAQVFFKGAPAAGTTVKLAKATPSLNITLGRASADALDVPIAAVGEDALKYFNVPATVSFAEDQKEAILTISAKDVNAMPINEFFPITISIDEESLITAYGSSEISFQIGVSLPWIEFDKGTIFETPYWGEQEEIAMSYQQLTDEIRYCVVKGCFGHGTGPSYDVQDYTWYWNTTTNQVYIPVQYMGYENKNGKTWFSDESAFYNLYWAMKNGAGYGAGAYGAGAGQVEGTAEWFEFCDAFRAKYPEDYYPYYDGKGTFYLADQYIAGYPGDAEVYLGRYVSDGWSDGYDSYVCSFAADYTIALTCDGVLQDTEGKAFAAGSVEFEGADVAAVAIAIVAGTDPTPASALIEAYGEEEESEEPGAEPEDAEPEEVAGNVIVLEAAGVFQIPIPEIAENYTIVAAPYNAEGGLEWGTAVYDIIAYKDFSAKVSIEGPELDIVNNTGALKVEIGFGKDTRYVMYALVAGKGDDVVNEALAKIDATEDNPFKKTYDPVSLEYTLTEVGDYTVIAVPFAEGKAWVPVSKSVNFDFYELVGTGTFVDDLALPLFSNPVTAVPCTIYNHIVTPGKYKIKDFSLPLVAAAFEQTVSVMEPYIGIYWDNVDFIVDATDPDKVSFATQNLGICLSTQYGFIYGASIANGTFKDGIISFPVKGCAVGFGSLGYYANNSGKFMIAMPGVEIPEDEEPAEPTVASVSGMTPVFNANVVKGAYATVESGRVMSFGAKNMEISTISERF